MKKSISSAFIAAILFGCTSAPDQQQHQTAPALAVLTVNAKEVTTYQDFPASVKGIDNVEIRPQVTGTLEQVLIDEGVFVNAGQPLFKIDDRPFKAALSNAVASLHAAEGVAANANLEVEKLAPLVQNNVVADYQLKTAKAAARVADANIEMARANITTARINLNYTLIKAPLSGYIGRLLKKKGTLVNPADPTALTDLSDVHHVHVYFALAEKDFVTFKDQYEGETLQDKLQHVESVSLVLSDNSVYANTGRIDMIDGQFNETTGAIDLRADFPNTKGLLRSGNTGKIRLPLAHKNVITVPQSATLELQDKIYVFAIGDGNKVKKQGIKVIGKTGSDFLVSEGLRQGDRIVTEGLGFLAEGTVINPQNSTGKVAVVKK